MSWLNDKIFVLLELDEIKTFMFKHNLNTVVINEIIYVFNKSILIKIYEELGYLYMDFYDLKNLRWRRDLDHLLISKEIIPQIEVQKIFEKYTLKFQNTVLLSPKTIALFYTRMELLEKYMLDFIDGNLQNYDFLLENIAQKEQYNNILAFKKDYEL